MGLINIGISLTGKITDPTLGKQVQDAVNKGLLELATIEGQTEVQKQLKPGHGRRTGTLQRRIGAALPGPYFAQFDAGQNRYGENLIYSYWVEGVSTLNAKSIFKGFKMFEKAENRLKSSPNLWRKYIGEHLMKVFQ